MKKLNKNAKKVTNVVKKDVKKAVAVVKKKLEDKAEQVKETVKKEAKIAGKESRRITAELENRWKDASTEERIFILL